MNIFRFSALVLSITLMFSIGSSSSATTDYSHPAFSVADDRVLNLRETGSQIVMETIEDALRQGGVALFGEGFHIDSSLNWVFGETIEGEIDAVLPLWSKDGHIIFAQPGLIVWTGIEEANRVDRNLGVVYRAPVGFGAIGGASIFYDHGFQVGHSRISLGADIQRGYLRGSANYYQPLSDEKGGRTGYIEQALSGMDARLVYERSKLRVSGNLGYWKYGEIEGSEGDWELSYGLEAGVRIRKGVFVEAGYEKHDDASIGGRFDLGVALKFSLPDFEGASYGDGSRSVNLYKIVDREKRILYEERKLDGILLSPRGNVVEGGTVNVSIQLRQTSTEDVVINLVGSGSATYGTDDDWTVSVAGTVCDTFTGTDCRITITAGETVADSNVVITINNDGRGEDAETIILSTVVASGDTSLTSRPLVLTIPADPPFPTASFSYTAGDTLTISRTTADAMLDATLNLSEALSENVTVNIATSGTAVYGHQDDWDLSRRVPAGDDDTHRVLCDVICEVMFPAGQTSADIQFTAYLGSAGRTVVAEIQLPTAAQSLLRVGSPSRLDFTIEDEPAPTASLNYSGSTMIAGTSSNIRMRINLSEALNQDVTVSLHPGGTATYANDGAGTWNFVYHVVPENQMPGDTIGERNDCPPADATSDEGCRIVISRGRTIVDIEVVPEILPSREIIMLTLGISSAGSTGLVLGTPSTQMLTVQ